MNGENTGVTKWRVAALLWMTMIFALSSAAFAPKMSFDATLDFFGTINYVVRKCAHAGEFGVLMWLWFRALYPQPFTLDKARRFAVSISLLYAASDEFHQSFVPERSGQASDVLFDAAGILVVAYLVGLAATSGRIPLRRWLIGAPPESV